MNQFLSLRVVSGCVAFGFGLLAMTLPAAAEHHEKSYDGPDPRIGAEVDRICFNRNISGWRSVKGEDDVVLLNRGVNRWYRVELAGACSESLLRFAQKIAIDSRPSGGCVTRGDAIIVEDGPGFSRRCLITDMYEWDDDAVAEPEEDTEGEDESNSDY